MSASVCICNNRGGVGKTFAAFQIAAAVATNNPKRKVLAIDFSIYSDLSALMLGGTAAENPLETSFGLSQAKGVPREKRVEGLLQTLASGRPAGKGLFGAFRRRAVDLTEYAVRVADHNDQMPPNVYLIASAGRDSYDDDTKTLFASDEKKGDEMAAVLREAIDALREDFCVAIFDTDHLSGSLLTRLALAAAQSSVVPCPTDTAEFHRLREPSGSV